MIRKAILIVLIGILFIVSGCSGDIDGEDKAEGTTRRFPENAN